MIGDCHWKPIALVPYTLRVKDRRGILRPNPTLCFKKLLKPFEIASHSFSGSLDICLDLLLLPRWDSVTGLLTLNASPHHKSRSRQVRSSLFFQNLQKLQNLDNNTYNSSNRINLLTLMLAIHIILHKKLMGSWND